MVFIFHLTCKFSLETIKLTLQKWKNLKRTLKPQLNDQKDLHISSKVDCFLGGVIYLQHFDTDTGFKEQKNLRDILIRAKVPESNRLRLKRGIKGCLKG